MQSNATNASSSTGDVAVLVGLGISLVTTIITSITTLLTLTYIVVRARFQDKQTMDIEISATTKCGGSQKIKISLLNHEAYSKKSTKFSNDKQSKNNNLSEKNTNISIDKTSLDNNHNGDLVIAETRYKTIQYALNTFAKINQQDLSSSGNIEINKDVEINILGETSV
jgi:hypothetical protein